MRLHIIVIILLFLVILCHSCQKEISISPPGYSEKPSIQGIIEVDSFPKSLPKPNYNFLSPVTKSTDLVYRNAMVDIVGNNVVDHLTLDSIYNYLYCQYEYYYRGHILSVRNVMYQLDIKIGATHYMASASTSINPVTLDSIGYTMMFKDVYGEHEGIIVYFKDLPGSKDYYRFEQLRAVDSSMKHASIKLSLNNSCLGGDTIMVMEKGRSIYSDDNADGLQLKIVIEPAFTHREGLSSTIRIQSVDINIFKFYDQIDKQKLAQLNPFVEPIFLSNGQFGSAAVGYFGCLTNSEGLLFVFPE